MKNCLTIQGPVMNLLLALIVIRLCRSFQIVPFILKDFHLNQPDPIDLFSRYDVDSVNEAFVHATSEKSVELMKWLVASTVSNPEQMERALWPARTRKPFYTVTTRAGLYELAIRSSELAEPRQRSSFILRIVRTTIKSGTYATIKGKVPLELLGCGKIKRMVMLALKEENCFFDLMDDVNRKLLGLYRWGFPKIFDLNANPRFIRYLRIYPTYYNGSDYEKDVHSYYCEFKNDKQMVQAIWANLKSINYELLDDLELGIRVKDIIESIPLLGDLEYALKSNQPLLIDHALKSHENTYTISGLWDAKSPGLWYALQNDQFRRSFVERYSTLNLQAKGFVYGLELNKGPNYSPGNHRSMKDLSRALIIAHPEIITGLQPQILEVMYTPDCYISSCLCLAYYAEFDYYAERAKSTYDSWSPLRRIEELYQTERCKAAKNFKIFCKAVLDRPVQSQPWDRLALAGFGELSEQDHKNLIKLSLENDDFDIAYLALLRLEGAEKVRLNDPELYNVLVRNIGPSYRGHFKLYPEFVVRTFNIEANELASSIPSCYHYLSGRLLPELDLMTLYVRDSGPVLVHIAMIMRSDDEELRAALGRILPFVNSMNSVQLLFALKV